jgi:hypothetical protein
MHDLAFFIPIKVDLLQIRIRRHFVSDRTSNLSDLVMVIAFYPKHDWISRWRPCLNELEVTSHIGKSIGELGIDFCRQFLARVDIFGNDDKLHVIIGRQHRLCRKDKTRCALAYIVGIILDAVALCRKKLGEPFRFCF